MKPTVHLQAIFILFSAALFATLGLCGVTTSDLRGRFGLQRTAGRFAFCTGDVLLSSLGRNVTRVRVANDNDDGTYSEPCAMSLPYEMEWAPSLGPRFGRTVYRNVKKEEGSRWTCGDAGNVTVRVFRTTRDTSLPPRKGGIVPLRRDRLYFWLSDDWRSCVWSRDSSIRISPSPPPMADAVPKPESTTTAANPGNATTTTEQSGGGNNSNNNNNNNNSGGVWEWLGPVLGAGATIIAAVLTVYLSHEYWGNRLSRLNRLGLQQQGAPLDGRPRQTKYPPQLEEDARSPNFAQDTQ